MASFDIRALLSFVAGWHPPQTEFAAGQSRWQTWREFMDDWVAVREEVLADDQLGSSPLAFAERVYRRWGREGPPAACGYDDVRAVLAAAEDETAAELLTDVSMGG